MYIYIYIIYSRAHARMYIFAHLFLGYTSNFSGEARGTRAQALTHLRCDQKILESMDAWAYAHNLLSFSLLTFFSLLFFYFLSRTLVADRRACTRVLFPIDEERARETGGERGQPGRVGLVRQICTFIRLSAYNRA